MSIAQARLDKALRSALRDRGHCSNVGADQLDESIEFLVSECSEAGLLTLTPVEVNEGSRSRTLEELASHPWTGVLATHLEDLLNVPNQDILLTIDEILHQYGKPEASEDSADIAAATPIRECELCDRSAALTSHHLIPRSEHGLFVKRGFFTLDECRSNKNALLQVLAY